MPAVSSLFIFSRRAFLDTSVPFSSMVVRRSFSAFSCSIFDSVSCNFLFNSSDFFMACS